jgi:hypothetical protein
MVPTTTIKGIMCAETMLLFREKGFELITMGQCNLDTRILIFNRKTLEEDVYTKDRFEFLQGYGYSIMPLNSMLGELTLRLNNCDVPFPHEVGVFMGYPLEDIKNFKNKSTPKESQSSYWKIYRNQEKTRIVFDNYQKNREININKHIEGVAFDNLIKEDKTIEVM